MCADSSSKVKIKNNNFLNFGFQTALAISQHILTVQVLLIQQIKSIIHLDWIIKLMNKNHFHFLINHKIKNSILESTSNKVVELHFQNHHLWKQPKRIKLFNNLKVFKYLLKDNRKKYLNLQTDPIHKMEASQIKKVKIQFWTIYEIIYWLL